MLNRFTRDRQIREVVKNNDHFVLVYPNTPAGRTAAKGAVRDWLMNCELDFNRRDAEMLWKAIDASRVQATFDRFSKEDVRPPGRRA